MIKIEKLDKYFNKGKSNENHVLKEVSLELGDRGLVCILGESGSGKTTLLNTIGGLDTFKSGTVKVDDVVLRKYEQNKIERLRNQKFGYIFQNYYLLQDYTVAYNVKLALNVFDLTEEQKDERVDYVLEALGMSRYKKKRISQLSGGQQQRVSIARALVKSPEIILADEPTGNLDEENTLKTMSILKSISKECLVILVSHEKAIAKFFADRIIEIQDGEIKRDYANDPSGGYQKIDDSDIYLKDMEQQRVEEDFIDLSMYREKFHRDDLEEQPEGKLHINLAWKDGKLYIQTEDNVELVLTGEESGCVMRDASRPKLDQSQMEEISYHLPKLKAGRSMGLPMGQIWKLACENIRMLGKKHRFIVGILLATSVLLVLALADFMMQHDINKQEVVTQDSHYVTVQLEPANGDDSEVSKAVEKYCQETLTSDIKYNALQQGTLNLSYDGFRQLKQVNAKIDNFSAVDYSELKKEDLVCGRLPKNRKELVIDKWLLSTFQKSGSVVTSLYNKEESLLGLKVITTISNLELEIVGVSDTGEPSVYVSPYVAFGMNYGDKKIMSDEELRQAYPEEYGDVKLKGNQILVDENQYQDYEQQKRWQSGEMITGQAEQKLGLDTCKIVGKCPLDSGAEYVLPKDKCEEIRMAYVVNAKQFQVYTDDVEGTIACFEKKGKDYKDYFKVRAQSNAQLQIKEYQKEQKESGLNAGYIVTIAVAVLSLIMIYFTIKSNAMARSEELTVYRLIGISPGSILKAYMLEMVMMTAYTCIPAILITSGVIKFITSIPSLEIYLLFPWWMAALLILAMFTVNIIVSILPVRKILHTPPAQLVQ
ncbi:ATP-binding cassette domain-containing protein [Jutongia sp.]|uniref:ATP-binding cassette domain-containing protein n=1 Tax=Jutongia sp. TaxID=2944204 RepID=UPI0030799354